MVQNFTFRCFVGLPNRALGLGEGGLAAFKGEHKIFKLVQMRLISRTLLYFSGEGFAVGGGHFLKPILILATEKKLDNSKLGSTQ